MIRTARSRPPRRRLAGAVLAAAALVAGCAAPAGTSAPPPLDELLRQAETSRAGGDRETARRQWHEATRLHPLSAQPWRRLAEDHFRTGENGSAIVAAQEAARRDPQDRVAQSILAVAGLRVSSSALVTLRDSDGVPADTRGEAAALTRLLRETLAEPVLVPAPEPASPARPRRGARPAGVAASVGSAAAASTPAPRPQTPPALPIAATTATRASPGSAPPVPPASSARGAAPAADPAAAPLPRPTPALASLPSANPFDRLR